MRRFWMLLLSWLGLLLIVVGINLALPRTFWGGVAGLAFNVALPPASCWLGFYFLVGPAAAHEWLGHFLFVVNAWPNLERLCNEQDLDNHLRDWRSRR